MVRIAVIVLLLLQIACTPTLPAGVHRSQITGIDGAFSAQQVVSDHPHYVMIGHVYILRRGDTVALIAEVGQAYNSGQYRLRMDTAWRDGQQLRFRGARRLEDFCVSASDCAGYRTGTFPFTREAFMQATRHGFRAHMLGPDAMVEVVFPAEMFQEVTRQALAADLVL